jgi:YggT family protein
MISAILSVLSAAVSIYTILCLIDIFMSWIPGLKFTSFGRFISAITEPYMGFFSRLGFLRFGNVDFSPILSIGILSLLSSILSNITATGRIWFGGILASVISMLWSVVSSVFSIFGIVIFIRWIVLLFSKNNSYNPMWSNLDGMLGKFTYKISRTFTKGQISYKTSLLITWIVMAVAMFLCQFLVSILFNLCRAIPF